MLTETQKKAVEYDLLKLNINTNLNVYKDLLLDYERELTLLIKNKSSEALINFQQTLVGNTKAKISVLEDLI